VNGLSGARLGVLATSFGEPLLGYNPDFDAAFAEALSTLTARGATLRPGLAMAPALPNEAFIAEVGVLAVGRIDQELGEYFATNRHPTLHSLADLVAASRVLGPDVVKILHTLEETLASPRPTDARWNAAQAVRAQYIAAVTKVMDDAHGRCARVSDAHVPCHAAPGVRIDPGWVCKDAKPLPYAFGDGYGGEAVLMASVSGFPEITVPAGFTKDGLPIALSFFGRPFSEATLIKLAYAYEQASRKRRPPAFLR
jgi:amidase